MEGNEHSGRSSTCCNDVIIKEVKTLIMANHCLTVREIGDELGISKDSGHAILMQDLGMRRVSAKFVPRLLSGKQKQVHLDIAQDLLQTTDDNPVYLNSVITGDESWVYGYDPETKAQLSPSERISVILSEFLFSLILCSHYYLLYILD